ncbi:MAG: helix-turn-helix transcriptional regulator [Sphingomonas sp.]|nr:helix-turn-helix transcriptional regulator [Sphingomonas sp.]
MSITAPPPDDLDTSGVASVRVPTGLECVASSRCYRNRDRLHATDAHLGASSLPIVSLFRLPSGLTGLRADFGARLRRHRRDEGLTQADLAGLTGLGRGTVSRIESGRVQPRPDTIDQILGVLQLDMGRVAVTTRRMGSGRSARYFDGSSRGDARYEIGRAIRAGRKFEGRSLRDVAKDAGLSAAQLSRIERGEGDRSSAYADYPADASFPKSERRFSLVNPELVRLAGVGSAATGLMAEEAGTDVD